MAPSKTTKKATTGRLKKKSAAFRAYCKANDLGGVSRADALGMFLQEGKAQPRGDGGVVPAGDGVEEAQPEPVVKEAQPEPMMEEAQPEPVVVASDRRLGDGLALANTDEDAALDKELDLRPGKAWAVICGRGVGLFYSYDEAKKLVDKYSGAIHQRFDDCTQALVWLDTERRRMNGGGTRDDLTKQGHKKQLYAVAHGRRGPAVYLEWASASLDVTGYSHAAHRKFATKLGCEAYITAHYGEDWTHEDGFQ